MSARKQKRILTRHNVTLVTGLKRSFAVPGHEVSVIEVATVLDFLQKASVQP